MSLPLKRLRLELDRAIRSRAFFGRAIDGRLSVDEYVDLLFQLAELARVSGGATARDLLRLDHQDRESLGAADGRRSAGEPIACPGLELFEEVFAGRRPWLSEELGLDVTLAVAGTSWTSEAAPALGARYPAGTCFLGGLFDMGCRSLQRLEWRLEAGTLDADRTYALAELTRGAVLAIATHLDAAWPPPYVVLGAIAAETPGRIRSNRS